MPERLLLCTDLDRTLLPNGPEPESPGARQCFARLAGHGSVTLAYVTGRHQSLVEEAMAEYALPPPDYVIGDVGTSIYRISPGGDWARETSWEAELEADWRGLSPEDLLRAVRDVGGLEPQEAAKQNRYKLSFYTPLELDRGSAGRALSSRLEPLGVATRCVFSTDEPAGRGLLDILPASASKYHALRVLQGLAGFDDNGTLFAGDSGNDLEVLASAIPSVLVANASPEVRRECLRRAREAGHAESLYLAAGGFRGMNGNYSAGILEGVAHFFPGAGNWF